VLRMCSLHPEFGYIGTPGFRRGVIAFAVCGLVAGTCGIAIFKAADPEPDPMRAMAFVPVDAVSSAARLTPTAMPERSSGRSKFSEVGAIKPRCAEAGRTRRPRFVVALNERPAIAMVPIGRRDDPAVHPPEATAPVAAPEDADVAPSAVTASVEPTPTSVAAVIRTKPRARPREMARRREREHHEHASTPRYYGTHQAYRAGGYASLW
jgi:hypothetical protein